MQLTGLTSNILRNVSCQRNSQRKHRTITAACLKDGSAAVASAEQTLTASPQGALSRRQLQLAALGSSLAAVLAPDAQALGFKKELKKKAIPLEEYSTLENGLQYYDLADGQGKAVGEGERVTVHFDCKFRGIDAVSTRSARTLGGNRTVAEPYEFIAGGEVSNKAKKINDSAGGLFAGTGGPKPPPALALAVVGMKAGGKRTVRVPPELGYGDKGEQEIPPNQSFDLLIEVLRVG